MVLEYEVYTILIGDLTVRILRVCAWRCIANISSVDLTQIGLLQMPGGGSGVLLPVSCLLPILAPLIYSL